MVIAITSIWQILSQEIKLELEISIEISESEDKVDIK
jgi:hypothetical protein